MTGKDKKYVGEPNMILTYINNYNAKVLPNSIIQYDPALRPFNVISIKSVIYLTSKRLTQAAITIVPLFIASTIIYGHSCSN